MREKDLEGHFKSEDTQGKNKDNKKPEAAPAPPAEEKTPEEEQAEEVILKGGDYQLERALDLLKSWEIFQAVQKRKAG